MEHTSQNKSYTGIIIAIVVLVAVLVVISVIPRTTGRSMTNDEQSTQTQQTMNGSDEPDEIESDIDSRLETDF